MAIRSSPLLPEVRDLIAQLQAAGYVNRGGRGSHRNFVHPGTRKPVTMFGQPGDDAKPDQLRAALEEAEK